MWRKLFFLCVVPMIVLIGCSCTNNSSSGGGGGNGTVTVFAFNDLGMHCMNEDFSEMMILPPFNNMNAQVIQRGDEPTILTSGVTVNYTFPSNTISTTKTNFWQFANALFGVNPAQNIGLTGNGLSGTMSPLAGTNIWQASGIPLTPKNDSMQIDPYQLATVTVMRNGQQVASTQAVAPVSWEISCNLCHNKPGITTAMDILQTHDDENGTNLVAAKPVACGSCHRQPPLQALLPGNPNLPTLSSAIHSKHASRMGQAGLANSCYACHPGVQTQCMRGVHKSQGLTCTDCHGTMTQVGNPAREPWADEPRCASCHPINASHSNYQFEQAGTLYRDSKGHHGVYCATCHGSPHAITPSTEAKDNIQATVKQGHAGPIDTCTVCHTSRPDDAFSHRYSGN